MHLNAIQTLIILLAITVGTVITRFLPPILFPHGKPLPKFLQELCTLLSVIGGNMLKEAFSKDEETADASFAPRVMLLLAVATSIDALAVGITLALLPGVNIVAAVLFIGCITFILSSVGLKVGNVFGLKYKNKAEMVGGAILILMGLKILLEHLGVIQF